MKKIARILLRILKISGIALVSLLIMLFLAPYLFPDTVGKQIKQWTNQSIHGDLNFTRARLSFFTHFPSLTLTLYDVDLKGSAPFQQDTLLSAAKLGFGVNLQKLVFGHTVSINKIYLNGAYIHILVNEAGQANYNIYISDTSKAKTASPDSAAASLHLEKIVVKESRLEYRDESIPMLIQAEHLFYEGTGDLSKSVFDLTSHLRTDSLNFVLNNKSYVKRKTIDANLITHINTKTLAFIFENNQLRMNKLNLAFRGKLDFLKNGYDMDFNISTRDADLYQLITAFPPQYLDWLEKTTVRGTINATSTLKGKYIASTGESPDFGVSLAIHDGYIAYQDSKLPVSQMNSYTSVTIPSLDPEQLHIKVDSMNFRMGNDYFHGRVETVGLSEPRIDAAIDAQMDLQNLQQAMGIGGLEMRGRTNLKLVAKGKYAKKIVKTSLRKTDTVIASIPSFDLHCSLKNGFVKYDKVTQPLENVFVAMNAVCPDSNYRHAYFKIDSLHATAMKNFVDGKAVVHASPGYPMDVHLNGNIDLSEIKQVFPLDSLEIAGLVHFDISCNGKYSPEGHFFPKTAAAFSMKDGFVKTKYYPHPIEKINLELKLNDDGGTMKSLSCSVRPASLSFEGKQFQITGDFRDFDDLGYNMSVDGELDLGKIYQVFARKDMGMSGLIRAHASFKGKQSDATAGNYDKLYNSGNLELRNFSFTHEMFPQPFFISQGNFKFEQEKMWFETFRANYGRSDLQLEGFMVNAVNYFLGKNETLKANFDLKSKLIDLNEFAVFSSPSGTAPPKTDTVHASSKAGTGVIQVPKNVDLTIKADADKIRYSDVTLQHFLGGVNIRNGEIELTETGFELIGCQVSMKGKYVPQSFTRAEFEYSLQAKDFDVQRAYKEIKIFHDLASSAAHASGIISIDYALSGKLNEQMFPVYPSLKGGGVLTVKNVKFNNWKLFNVVSSESGKSELKDPDLSKIDVKSSIKNNLITIERTKFKTGGFRIRIEGQTSFDNKINFKMRIGLPPLGIIGIPLRVTGSSDNPKIKLGKSDTDPLEEKSED